MIECQNVTKYYGDRKVVDDLSFSVGKGEILGFLGPNGAGKSTTMKILTCFLPATSGVAKVAGYDVYDSPIEVKKRVGYLPETPPIYKEMIVSDYLAYKAKLHGLRGPSVSKAVQTALGKCGLADVKHRIIGNLSKGYKQRVGIAQAIVHNPDVLILDEPTVGLDPKQIIDIRSLIKSFAGDHTVILSTHILPEVQATCSRVLIINEGKKIVMDTLDKISAHLHGGKTLELLVKDGSLARSSLSAVSGIRSIDDLGNQAGGHRMIVHTDESADIRDAVSSAIVKSGAGLLEQKMEKLSLEEVFVKLTTVEKTQ